MNPSDNQYNDLLIQSGKLTTYLSILPILVFIWKWNKMNRSLKIFSIFLIVKIILNTVSELFIWSTGANYEFWKPILDKWKIENVLFINILFYLNSYIFLGRFFIHQFVVQYQNIFKLLIVVICIFSLLVYTFIDGYQGYGYFGPILQACFVCSISFLIMWKIVENGSVVSLKKNPIFIICIGLFLSYFISIFFKFIAEKLYYTDFVLYCKFHIARNILEVISQIFFALAFYRAGYAKYLISR